jgi:hypothetical protein
VRDDSSPPPKETQPPYPVVHHLEGVICCGEGSYIWFWPAEKRVAVILGGEYLAQQTGKLASRYKADERLVSVLQAIAALPEMDHGSRLLKELLSDPDSRHFERKLRALVSSIRAVRSMLLEPKGPPKSSEFVQVILKLARLHQRPPFKRELADALCIDQPTTSKLCRAHGFGWLPRSDPGRPRGKSLV